MKSELNKKSFQWMVGEDKVLWNNDNRKLRRAAEKMKTDGMEQHDFPSVRNWFMIEIGLLTGLRVMEVRDLRISDLVIRNSLASIHVRCGKGGKKRDVYINAELKKECYEFLSYRKKFGLGNDPENHVFCSSTGNPMTTRGLQKAFKRCLKIAKISNDYTFHCMRHTYATFLLDLSNLRVVQEQLGHSSVKTTEIYTALVRRSVKKTLDRIYK